MPRFLGGLNFERGPRTLDLDQRPVFTEKRSVQTMPVMGCCFSSLMIGVRVVAADA